MFIVKSFSDDRFAEYDSPERPNDKSLINLRKGLSKYQLMRSLIHEYRHHWQIKTNQYYTRYDPYSPYCSKCSNYTPDYYIRLFSSVEEADAHSYTFIRCPFKKNDSWDNTFQKIKKRYNDIINEERPYLYYVYNTECLRIWKGANSFHSSSLILRLTFYKFRLSSPTNMDEILTQPPIVLEDETKNQNLATIQIIKSIEPIEKADSIEVLSLKMFLGKVWLRRVNSLWDRLSSMFR